MHRSLLVGLLILIGASPQQWASERTKLAAVIQPDLSLTADATVEQLRLLQDALNDQLNSVEHLTAHTRGVQYKVRDGERQTVATFDADVRICEHTEWYTQIYRQASIQAEKKRYSTMQKLPFLWSTGEFIIATVAGRNDIVALKSLPARDVVDGEPALLLEANVAGAMHRFTYYRIGSQVHPDLTARYWFSARSGHLLRVWIHIGQHGTDELLSGATDSYWDIRYRDVTVDGVNTTVPVRSSWSMRSGNGTVKHCDKEFSEFHRLPEPGDIIPLARKPAPSATAVISEAAPLKPELDHAQAATQLVP